MKYKLLNVQDHPIRYRILLKYHTGKTSPKGHFNKFFIKSYMNILVSDVLTKVFNMQPRITRRSRLNRIPLFFNNS